MTNLNIICLIYSTYICILYSKTGLYLIVVHTYIVIIWYNVFMFNLDVYDIIIAILGRHVFVKTHKVRKTQTNLTLCTPLYPRMEYLQFVMAVKYAPCIYSTYNIVLQGRFTPLFSIIFINVSNPNLCFWVAYLFIIIMCTYYMTKILYTARFDFFSHRFIQTLFLRII